MALLKKEEELREKKFGSRRNKAITLDIAGKSVVEEHSEIGRDLHSLGSVALYRGEI